MSLAEISKLSKLVLGETWVKHHPLLIIQHKGKGKVTLAPRWSKRSGRVVLPKLPRKLKKRFLSNPGGFTPKLREVYIYCYMTWLQPRLEAKMDSAYDGALDKILQDQDHEMLAKLKDATTKPFAGLL